jgi:hypothetical protein
MKNNQEECIKRWIRHRTIVGLVVLFCVIWIIGWCIATPFVLHYFPPRQTGQETIQIPDQIPDHCKVLYGGKEIGVVHKGAACCVAIPNGGLEPPKEGWKMMMAGFDTKEQAVKWLVENYGK